ncbi:MAG: hypothetical protein OQK24_10080 [Magnetovibrio sp.]|nr:hypothetical protein [Magnetovibrio sp.]
MGLESAIRNLGNIAAVIGILLCLVAGLSRLAGMYYVAGFEAMTLLNGGIALMVAAILMKIELLARKPE